MKKQLLVVSTLFLSSLAFTAFADEKAAAPAEKAATPAPAADMATAEKNYKAICFSCHDNAIAGAPKLSDTAAWTERVAQGKDKLYSNVINGFTGKTGTMPPRGGSQFKDDELKGIVDYMIMEVEKAAAPAPADKPAAAPAPAAK